MMAREEAQQELLGDIENQIKSGEKKWDGIAVGFLEERKGFPDVR
jgi:hypothetical protein